MQVGPFGHPLDRRDRPSFYLHRQQQAAQLGLAVHQHGARPALAELTAVLRARQLHVLAKHLEQRLVHGQQELGMLAVDLERDDVAVDLARHLLLHGEPSIAFRAWEHAQRSGATAWARLDVGIGSSGWTRIVRMPSASAGSMSFDSLFPITTHRSASAPPARIASSNTAGCGLRCPASTEVTIACTWSAMPSSRKSSQ